MANPPASSEYGIADDSFDAEVFFGPMTDVEVRLARRLMKRRTELYIPACSVRPSLEEFRHANYLPTTDDSSCKDDDDFVDSLEEKSAVICRDSGFDSKPCTDTDDGEAGQNCPAAAGDSFCTVSTTYFSAVSEADHHSPDNDAQISMVSDSHYSTASEARTTCFEDSLNDTGRISSGSRIEHANDSLEVHSRRQSSILCRDSILRPLLLFGNDASGDGEVVPESSFDQDSDSAPENELERKLESLDRKDDSTDGLKIHGLNAAAKCSSDPDISQHSDLAHSPSSITEQFDRLSIGSDSVLPAPPASPELSLASIVSESSDILSPERSRAAEEEFLSVQNPVKIEQVEVGENKDSLVVSEDSDELKAPKLESGFVTFTFSPAKNFQSILNFKKLLPSPLMSSDIPRSSESAHAESCAENCDASNRLISTDTNTSPPPACLKNFTMFAESYGSGYLENLDLPKTDTDQMSLHILLKNECCEDTEPLAQFPQSDGLEGNEAPDLKLENINLLQPSDDTSEDVNISEKVITISPEPENHDVETQVDRATSCSQSEVFKPVAIEQGCQTSFIGSVIAPSAETVDRGHAGMPSLKGQKAKSAHKSTNGQPRREPIFKTPTKPALRVPQPFSGSGSKTKTTPKASPLPSRSPMQFGKRLAPPTKTRFDHITSPIAKYINDSAVPPLISNSRPIVTRSTKLRTTPNTKIPVPGSHSSTKKPSTNTATPANKRILMPSKKGCKTQLPVAKGKNVLDFAYNCGEDGKENSSVEDSIFEELKISVNELKQINNRKLKKDVLDYVKTRKAMIVNAAKEASIEQSSGSNQIGDAPCVRYKGASSLAMKQVALLTEIHTVKNKNVVCSPGQPTILKHTGERKVLHWANGLVTEVDALSSPSHPKIIAPAIFMKTAHKKSTGSVDNDLSTVDVSIVEVVNQVRTNTLAKQ